MTQPADPTTISSPPKPNTWPDVAMALVRELPIISVTAVVCILGIKGSLTAEQEVIGLGIALLGRSRPPESFAHGARIGFFAALWRNIAFWKIGA